MQSTSISRNTNRNLFKEMPINIYSFHETQTVSSSENEYQIFVALDLPLSLRWIMQSYAHTQRRDKP